MADTSLAWLLQPLSVQTFLDEVWGQTHHHVKRSNAGYFDSLLQGPSVIDELLEHVRPEPSGVRLVRRGEDKDPGTYRLADGSLDVARVRNDFADGYTIVLNRLEQYVRAIGTLSHAIEVELNFPTRVNGYITPPGSAGFVPHYDPHDVLILQIQGSKVWYLSNDAAVPPHEMHHPDAVATPELSSPTELRLAAGDVLYLPRGQVHGAETQSEPSVHLTVGIHAPTVLTLMTHVLYSLSLRDDGIHARLPARHLDDAGVRASLTDVVHDILRTVGDPSVIADGLGAMEEVLVRRGRCPPVGQVSNAVGIDGDTLVVKYQPLYSRVVADTGNVGLQFAQLLIKVGPDHKAAIKFVAGSSKPFRVRELPGLSPEQQTALARTLITTGFLVRLPDD
ncbi:cupin domain-containing protein [Mycobacterium celatum]|uniref:Cupin n=1 Tax=Mycobacterium celatum TaxID=28045 RepID=A0A1X1RR09_MYCCE|nr:cupin domain-containing protein [Mycobacterium celatum]ORV13425.1 cupin [Mycobacterium celatum]PIB78148.1 cupin [Mycobacterium celatum]